MEHGRNPMLATCLIVVGGVTCMVGLPMLLAAGVFVYLVSGDDAPVTRPIMMPPGARRTALVIAIDDLRRDHLAPYGYERDPAPRLTSLAARGQVVGDHVPASVATSAGLATLLSGLPPWRHGLASAREVGAHRLPLAVETIPEVLRDQGWATLGGVSLPHLGARLSGLDQGFSVWREGSLAAEELVASLDPELDEALRGDGDVFVFLHLADLRLQGSRPDRLHEYLAPFRAEDPELDLALGGTDVPAEVEQAVGRQRGSPAWLAWKMALYDADLAVVDSVLGGVLDRLDAADREDAAIVVVGTRGRFFDEDRPPQGAPEVFCETLLAAPAVAVGLGSFARERLGTADLAGALRLALLLPVSAVDAGDPLVAAPGLRGFARVAGEVTTVVYPSKGETRSFSRALDVELDPALTDARVRLPAELDAGWGWHLDARGARFALRLRSPRGELYLPAADAADWRVSPAGTSLEGVLSPGRGLYARTETRTAVLALDLSLDDAAQDWTTTLPVFPALPREDREARLRITREGAWVRVALDAGVEQTTSLVAHAYPPMPFGAALEVESLAASMRSLPGLDRVIASTVGSLEVAVRLRAGQTLAVEAEVDGEAVAWEDMSAEGGARGGTLAVYLSASSGGGAITRRAENDRVTLRREYPGPPMDAAHDLTDKDVRLLSRLGPNE